MGTLKVNGDISATGTISASSFLGNASSSTYTHQWRTTAENPCTTSTDSNTGIFNVPDSRVYWISETGTVIDQLNQWGYILDIGNNAERHQIWMTQSSGDMAHRGGNSNGWSGSWRILLDSINYTSYTVTKTGSGASGTWGINVTGSAGSVAWGNVTGKPSSFTPSSHTHDYLPLAGGGTLTGSAVINFPAGSVSVAASTPMSLSYGRLACYGTLCINANTDNSGTEYVILTAGKGLSSSTADGLAIGTSTLTWQGSTVLTTGNFPSSSSLARQTDTWISAASLDVNTYYPVVIDIPYQGLCRIKLAVQLNSSTRPSWSTHNAGFTSNIDVEIIAAGWGTVSPYRYLLRQDDWNFSNVKPAYFAGQLTNASKAVFYVRGGGSYRFICDWADASISLRTSSTTYNDQTVAPTTSTSIFHSGSKSHLYCNVDYASSAGNADTLDGSHASAFAAASHTHSYLPLSGGTMTGAITLASTGLRTEQPSGYYIDAYGNFYHQNTATTSYWNIFNNAGTKSLQYYYETGVLIAPRPATTNYGGTLPSSGVTGEIFYKI